MVQAQQSRTVSLSSTAVRSHCPFVPFRFDLGTSFVRFVSKSIGKRGGWPQGDVGGTCPSKRGCIGKLYIGLLVLCCCFLRLAIFGMFRPCLFLSLFSPLNLWPC